MVPKIVDITNARLQICYGIVNCSDIIDCEGL